MLHIEELHTYYGHGHILQGVNSNCRQAALRNDLGAQWSRQAPTLMRLSLAGATPQSGALCSTGEDIARWSPRILSRGVVSATMPKPAG